MLAVSLGSAEDEDGFAPNLDKTGFNLNIVVDLIVGMESAQEIALNLVDVRNA